MEELILTAELLEGFENHLVLEEKSQNTVEKYMRDGRAFARFARGMGITKETVMAYKQHLRDQYKVRSVNSMLASINSLFDFLGWHTLKVKAVKVQTSVYCPEEKELTKAEYERLCRTAEQKHNERLMLILQTVCGTGIRIGELPFITAEAVKKGEATVFLKGKTRSVFIVRALKQKLLRYAQEHHIKADRFSLPKTENRSIEAIYGVK